MKPVLVFALVCLSVSVVSAQQSANFRVEGTVVNAGGRPDAGVIASSSSFRVTLDSIGEAAPATELASGSFRGEAGLSTAYLPPLEAEALRFTSSVRLEWSRSRSAVAFNLYRDALSNLAGLSYGNCAQTNLSGPFAIDPVVPAIGNGFFYLVTTLNRLDEEGPKGKASDGSSRHGNACP